MKRLVAALSLLMLALPSPAMAKGTFHPRMSSSFIRGSRSTSGRLDMSINKAVAYLFLGAVVTILLSYFLFRFRLMGEPGKRQTVGEWVYDIAQVQVAEQGLPTKGDAPLVPVRLLAAAVHLDDQHPRLHPAPADRRDVARHPRLGHLCGDFDRCR